MKFLNIVHIISFFLLNGLGSGLFSQENTVITGGEALGSGGNISYSIGQAVYTTSSGGNLTISQGVQQPYEIYNVTEIGEVVGIILQMRIYPNPVIDELVLKFENEMSNGLSYDLYDEKGAVLENKTISSSEMNILMSPYLPGIYFLKITSYNKELKIFKIIKN